MKEFIEKLIGRLEELKKNQFTVGCCDGYDCEDTDGECSTCYLNRAIEIANQLAEEYKHCIKSSCSNCETYDKEKHYCPKWCEVIKGTVKEIEENRWIFCSERLPEAQYGESELVLTSTVNQFGEMTMLKLAYYDGGCWCNPTGEVIEERKVIAWQPLPAPYQTKGE